MIIEFAAKILSTVEGVWLFLLKITETAPVGYWSFLIAAIVPAVLVDRFRRFLPATWYTRSRDFLVESFALAAGILLAWLPWQTLHGALVGILAGLLSPYLALGFHAVTGVLFRAYRRRLDPTFPPTPRRRVTDAEDVP